MKLTHSVLSLTLAAGLVGSVAAYRATAGEIEPEPAAAPSSAVSTTPARQLVLPGTTFAWAPCKPGARLERGTCVTDVVRTVVLPAAVPAASTVRTDEREDADHEEEYPQYEDDGDDDHGDDDHEDEDDEGDDD
ncbi:MAG: hypothetical protein Q8O61_14380 [Nocardioides sp.]|nr:hypothetical protein [Nocardioides sp.]